MFKHSHAILILLSAALYASAALAETPPATDEALLDPMRPPTIAAAAPVSRTRAGPRDDTDGYQLSAIRITAEQRSATLNGKTLSVGDRLGSARLTAIQASSVTLQQDGNTITISLLPLSIKKPVEAPQP